MSVIKLTTENPNLSWIIQKNPATGLVIREIRKGHGLGWFPNGDPQSYCLYFRDGNDEVSYPNNEVQEYEYLDSTRYTSAFCILSLIDEFIKTPFKKLTEQDVSGVYNSTFHIGMIHIHNKRYLEHFIKHFSEYEFISEEINKNNYSLTIKTNKSIYELVNLVALLCLFVLISNWENVYLNDDFVLKYISCMDVIDAPYYIRYLFKIKCFNTEHKFNQHRSKLERSEKEKIEMMYGDTWFARMITSKKNLTFKHDIIDIGCGEFKYGTSLAKYLDENDKKYIGIDRDPEVLNIAKRKANNKNINNAIFFESLEEFLTNYKTNEKVDIIVSEVIEHMTVDEATEFMKKILTIPNINRLIVTTPNKEFNKNYFLDDDQRMRHDDHKFEFNKPEFDDFIKTCTGNANADLDMKYLEIGDKVDGVPISQGYLFTSKN